jgi:hypothetical protein
MAERPDELQAPSDRIDRNGTHLGLGVVLRGPRSR